MLSVVLLLAMLAEALPAEHKIDYAPQQFRFLGKSVDSEDGQTYSQLSPYVPFSFGVVQLAGAKHRDKDVVTCTPGMIQTDSGRYTKLVCDDGSEFGIAVIVFPRKGQ